MVTNGCVPPAQNLKKKKKVGRRIAALQKMLAQNMNSKTTTAPPRDLEKFFPANSLFPQQTRHKRLSNDIKEVRDQENVRTDNVNNIGLSTGAMACLQKKKGKTKSPIRVESPQNQISAAMAATRLSFSNIPEKVNNSPPTLNCLQRFLCKPETLSPPHKGKCVARLNSDSLLQDVAQLVKEGKVKQNVYRKLFHANMHAKVTMGGFKNKDIKNEIGIDQKKSRHPRVPSLPQKNKAKNRIKRKPPPLPSLSTKNKKTSFSQNEIKELLNRVRSIAMKQLPVDYHAVKRIVNEEWGTSVMQNKDIKTKVINLLNEITLSREQAWQ